MTKKFLTPEQFNKLSRAKRAILVAEDVIKQIKLKIYKPDHSYNTRIINNNLNSWEFDELDASTVLKEQPHNIKCEGCARASLFISSVKFKNKLTVEDVQDSGFDYGNYATGTNYLSHEFSEEQQALIESTYEGEIYGEELRDEMFGKKLNIFNVELDKAVELHEKYKKDWKKSKKSLEIDAYILTRICQNIIKNNGTFKP